MVSKSFPTLLEVVVVLDVDAVVVVVFGTSVRRSSGWRTGGRLLAMT